MGVHELLERYGLSSSLPAESIGPHICQSLPPGSHCIAKGRANGLLMPPPPLIVVGDLPGAALPSETGARPHDPRCPLTKAV